MTYPTGPVEYNAQSDAEYLAQLHVHLNAVVEQTIQLLEAAKAIKFSRFRFHSREVFRFHSREVDKLR